MREYKLNKINHISFEYLKLNKSKALNLHILIKKGQC